MTAMKWTAGQEDAIKSRGDVQVAASAGTGKTAVLSHRCIDLLLDKDNPADIDRILVLTFTEDAAAEMKERIARTIRERIKQTHNMHLRRQLLRLDIADISTIHSFCRKLIADNFFRLGVDPDFTIIEGDEQKLLREQILADVIEKAWESAELSESMKSMLEGRNADLKTGVLKNVYAVDEFMNSLVAPDEWAKMCRRGCASVVDDQYAAQLKGRVEVCRSLCRQAAALDAELIAGHYSQNLSDFQAGLDDIEIAVKEKRFDRLAAAIDAVCSVRFRNRPKNSDERDYIKVRFPVTEIAKKKILQKIVEQLPSPEVINVVNSAQTADTAALLDIVQMFRGEYEKRKKELKCLDFSDLERLALRLLESNEEVAKELQRHYQYVFVDEYQDVNKVQDRIVQLVSAGQNLFIVGDVKQSIYSWRQARPELFLGRIKNADKTGAKNVYLNDNFRCREQIIDFVNAVFSQVMNADVAGMEYDEKAALGFGAKFYQPFGQICLDHGKSTNELHIITSGANEMPEVDGQTDADENEPGVDADTQDEQSSHRRQAMLIAKRVRQLVGGGSQPAELQIVDRHTNKLRSIEYGDIAILLRSLKGRVNDYVDVLRQNNIPVDAAVTGSYFESPEIGDCLSILKVIDNPLRDIELAAAMRSPVFGFSDSELFAVRQAAEPSDMPFYNCVLRSASGDNELSARINAMLATIEKWRNMAAGSRLAQVVWQILRHNDFLSFASALPGGLQKRADLLKLHERAVQFEGFVSTQGNPSLGRFVDFIERLRDSEGDWSQAEADQGQSGSVRVMSIHKSKGLEYPVVFLAGMEKRFNTADTRQMCLLDEDMPIGLKVYVESRGKEMSTNCFNVIKQKKYQSMIAEEMRTLYVAMTRAREKLIIVADTVSRDKTGRCGYVLKLLDELKMFTDAQAFNWWLSDCSSRSYLDWLIAALRSEPDISGLLRNGGMAAGLLDVSVTDAGELVCDEDTPAALTDLQADPQVIAGLRERLSRQYAYQGVLSLPVKNSVSKITHRDDEYKMDFFAAAIDDADVRHIRPDHAAIDPRTVGTAAHLVFENLPLEKKPQAEDVRQVIGKLKNRGALSEQIAALINIEQVLSFFDTEPGALLFAQGVKVYREYPFTIGISPKDCGFTEPGQDMGENIIVQGIIDLLLITPEGMVVVDFKTDNITAAGIEARAGIYKKQLRLYSYAVSRILKRSVAAQWLYFLKPMVAHRV